MTIHFLGTGPNQPIVHRRGKSRRLQTATCISHHGFTLLLDAGPSVVAQLRRVHISRIHAAALTHRHHDAVGGLPLLERWVSHPLLVFVEGGERVAYHPERFQRLAFTTFRPHTSFIRAPFDVQAFPVEHTFSRRFPTYGFHIRAGNLRVTYASDSRGIPSSSRQYFHGNDLLIVDGAGWERDLPNHRGILNHVGEYLRWRNTRVVFTQIGRAVPDHAEASRMLRQRSPRAQIAYDGLTVQL